MRRMHLIIMGEAYGLEVDHINGNKLDNQKSNLRFVTHMQNLHNRKPSRESSSKYKGVSWNAWHKRWLAKICNNYTSIFLGYFKSEEDAALAYNKAALKYHEEYARLNVVK